MTNQQKVINLRKIIEEIIPNFAIDSIHSAAIQIDYFEFYHAKLNELGTIDFKGSF